MEISVGQIFSVVSVVIALITFFVHQKFRSEAIEATLDKLVNLQECHNTRLITLEQWRIKYETLYGVHHGRMGENDAE